MLTASTLAPSFSHSAATCLSASSPPAASTRLQPAPASTFEASAPNAPDAPVTIAVLPRMSNSESGFLRKSSDMGCSLDSALRLLARLAGEGGRGASRSFELRAGPLRIASLAPPPQAGEDYGRHFTGATATAMVQTSLPRLMISRFSLGPM